MEYAGYNYNVKTGKLLALKDIVNDQDALKEALIEQLEVIYPEIESDTDCDEIATVLCESENALWNIGYQGLTFYIEPKLTKNSESNYLPVMISFAEYQDLFEQKYVSAPDRYVVDIDAFSPFAYDMNCDGKAERIDIICEGSSSIESLTVQIGNLEKEMDLQSLEEELSADKLQCKLMYMGNDKNLLYINTESYLDGLYQGVVLEAKDSEITVLNNDAGLDIGNSVITDPYHMMSQGYSSLLGSVWDFYTATSWKMDENGQLTKDAGAKEYLPSDFCIRTTKEISADKICLEDGSVIETQVELSSNTILVPYQTDNETYVDFMDQDENVYRIKFEITYDDDFGYIGTIAGNRVSDYMTVVKNS